MDPGLGWKTKESCAGRNSFQMKSGAVTSQLGALFRLHFVGAARTTSVHLLCWKERATAVRHRHVRRRLDVAYSDAESQR